MAPKYPFIASTLEKATLGDAYDPLKAFTYQEGDVQGHDPIIEENYD